MLRSTPRWYRIAREYETHFGFSMSSLAHLLFPFQPASAWTLLQDLTLVLGIIATLARWFVLRLVVARSTARHGRLFVCWFHLSAPTSFAIAGFFTSLFHTLFFACGSLLYFVFTVFCSAPDSDESCVVSCRRHCQSFASFSVFSDFDSFFYDFSSSTFLIFPFSNVKQKQKTSSLQNRFGIPPERSHDISV